VIRGCGDRLPFLARRDNARRAAGWSCAVLSIGVTVAVSASFETMQLFFGRNLSVTDVLLNSGGAAVAVLAWPRLREGWPRSRGAVCSKG